MRPLSRLPIMTAFRGRLAAFAPDERGASIVEFGLLFPILAIMVLGTIDVTRGIATRFALEQAAQRTIEIASLGNRTQLDYSFLRAEAAAAAGVPLTNVTLDQWLECRTAAGVSTRQTSFAGNCPADQQSARYVEIRMYRDYMPSFAYGPFASGFAGAQPNGSIRLWADAGVRVQ